MGEPVIGVGFPNPVAADFSDVLPSLLALPQPLLAQGEGGLERGPLLLEPCFPMAAAPKFNDGRCEQSTPEYREQCHGGFRLARAEEYCARDRTDGQEGGRP
ncbi:MAG TPA: hypothetical protein VMB73_32525 [Acetobacteraceae bacterium]|nr:hypothetical protein [Acetobacteraceae bacterium]